MQYGWFWQSEMEAALAESRRLAGGSVGGSIAAATPSPASRPAPSPQRPAPLPSVPHLLDQDPLPYSGAMQNSQRGQGLHAQPGPMHHYGDPASMHGTQVGGQVNGAGASRESDELELALALSRQEAIRESGELLF